jgi:hypothetical protein
MPATAGMDGISQTLKYILQANQFTSYDITHATRQADGARLGRMLDLDIENMAVLTVLQDCAECNTTKSVKNIRVHHLIFP